MLNFDFGRKARPTESKESLPRRSWSQSTTNAIKTMLTEKAPSIALNRGASNTKRYLFCRRAWNKAYDAIRGWRADDSYFSYARAFVNNTITVDQLGRAMKLSNLGEQIVLKSECAFKGILFAGFERAPLDLYGPLAKERDQEARAQYRELLAENPFEGIRIVDIRFMRPPKIHSPRLSSTSGTKIRLPKKASERHERQPA